MIIFNSFNKCCVVHLCILTVLLTFAFGQKWSGDTLRINPITFEDPSPVGWNAQYKTSVSFPDNDMEWSQILMVQTLKCDSATAGDKYPCGEWDYIWNTFIEVPVNDTIEIFTLGSFVTPYGKRLNLGGPNGWEWVYDITEYAPLLKGERELISGNNQELLNLEFVFIKGTPTRAVISVDNLYPYGEYKYEYLSTDSLLKEREVILDKTAQDFMLKAVVSGHGHAGPYNCCEWDSKTHTYRINGYETFKWNVWKDCGNNPIYPQGGTWPFDRAGWCPGTKVDEYEFNLTPKVNPGDTMTIDYSIEPFNNNGEKDGTFRMSHQLFSFGPPNFKYDAAIKAIIVPNSSNQYSRINPNAGSPLILIQNRGKYTLNNLTIKYGVKGHWKKKFIWQGKLDYLETERVTLPPLNWKTMRTSGTFEVELITTAGIQDEYQKNNMLYSYFEKHKRIDDNFVLHVETNNLNRATENTVSISEASGLVWYYYDEFEDSTTYDFPIELSPGSFTLKFSDQMEDGISVHWWNRNAAPDQVGINGLLQLQSVTGDTLVAFPADFGQEILFNFIVE